MDAIETAKDEVDDSEALVGRQDAGRLPEPRRRGLAFALVHIARNRWAIATNVIVATSRAAHLADQDQRDFARENQEALGQVLRGELPVALVVEQRWSLSAINFSQQGDSDMYGSEQLARRQANRSNPGLLEAVRAWWRWLPKVRVRLGGGPPGGSIAGGGGALGSGVGGGGEGAVAELDGAAISEVAQQGVLMLVTAAAAAVGGAAAGPPPIGFEAEERQQQQQQQQQEEEEDQRKEGRREPEDELEGQELQQQQRQAWEGEQQLGRAQGNEQQADGRGRQAQEALQEAQDSTDQHQEEMQQQQQQQQDEEGSQADGPLSPQPPQQQEVEAEAGEQQPEEQRSGSKELRTAEAQAASLGGPEVGQPTAAGVMDLDGGWEAEAAQPSESGEGGFPGAATAERDSQGSVASSSSGGAEVVEWSGGGGGGGGGDAGEAGSDLRLAVLDRPIYSAMVVAITWVLLPRFGIRVDPDYDPSDDWRDDNEGLPYMDFKHFFNAMFDLADMWSSGVEVTQYVDLLETVLRDVQQLEVTQGAFTRLHAMFRNQLQLDAVQAESAALPQQTQLPFPPPPSTQADQPQQGTAQETTQPLPDPRLPPPSSPARLSKPPHPFEITQQPHHHHNGPSHQQQRPQTQTQPKPQTQVLSQTLTLTFQSPKSPFQPHQPHHPHLQQLPAQPHRAAWSPQPAAKTPPPASPAPASAPAPAPTSLVDASPSLAAALVVGTSPPMLVPATSTSAGVAKPSSPSPPGRRPSSRLASSVSETSQAGTRRSGPFKVPQFAPIDVSGIRSTLAEYLRTGSPPRRPSPVPGGLQYDSSGRRRVRQVYGWSGGGQREALQLAPAAIHVPPPTLTNCQLGGSPGPRPYHAEGGVLMYEEYMHELAKRYLVRQEQVLMATSASAAAAAGELLAAAAAAAASASASTSLPPGAWESGDTGGGAGAGSPGDEVAGDGSSPLAISAADPGEAQPPSPGSPGRKANAAATGAAHSVPAASTTAAAAQGRAASGAGGDRAGSSSSFPPPPPGLVTPPPLPALAAPTIDLQLMDYMQPVCVVGHAVQAVQTDPGSALAGGRAVSPTGGRSMRTPHRHHSLATGAAVATAGGTLTTAGGTLTTARAPAATEVVGDAAAAAGGDVADGAPSGAAPAAAPPPAPPPPASAAAASSLPVSSRVSATGNGVSHSLQPARQHLQQQQGLGAPGAAAAAAAAHAQAQAQVVVAFAAAAYRLADPNVHSLLLPSRPQTSPFSSSTPSPSSSLAPGHPHSHVNRSFSGTRHGSPSYSPSGRRTRPPTAAAGPGTPLATPAERFAPYISPAAAAALSCMVPHLVGRDADTSGGDTDGGGGAVPRGAPTAAWPAPPMPPTPRAQLPVPGDGAAQATAAATGTFSLCSASNTELGTTGPTTTTATMTAAAPSMTAAVSLGGAVSRRLASCRTPPAGSSLLSASAPRSGSWSICTTSSAPLPAVQLFDGGPHLHSQLHPQHSQLQPHGQPHTAYIDDFQHGAMAQPLSSAGGAAVGLTPGGGSSGGGAGAVVPRWPSAPSTPGLTQTPRSGLWGAGALSGPRASSSSLSIAAATTVAGSGSGGGAGAGRRFSGPQVLAGGGGSGGVLLPNASMSHKLRNFYVTSPVSVVTPEGGLALPAAYAAAPVAALPFGGGGAFSAAAAAAATAAGTSSEEAFSGGNLPPVGIPGEAVTASADGFAAEGLYLGSSADWAPVYGRRATAEQLSVGAVAAGPAGSSGGGGGGSSGGGVAIVRSPMRIRSSDPVGFADAVTTARMNVAIMADELLQRQAEQRAQTKLMRERTLHLRPSTAAGRGAMPQSFGAFLAAREAATAATSAALTSGTGA